MARPFTAASRIGTIGGCYVTQGNIKRNAKVRVIRDGATLVESVDDILGELKAQLATPLAERRKPAFSTAPAPKLNESELQKAREKIMALLSPTPVPVDELIRQCQLSPAIVLTVVLELELAGRIERQPGNTLNLL